MKILFVCGCFEPGQDGVGDYVRTLGMELISVGCQVGVLALNDKSISEALVENRVGQLLALRLPFSMRWSERKKKALDFIAGFDPSIISVQLVPYSWHAKGVPFLFPHRLEKITEGYKLHLMFHELYIGAWDKSSLKQRMIGFLQKKLFISPLANLASVQTISTNTLLHACLLKKMGVSAGFLPLFGNVKVCKINQGQIKKWWFDKTGINRASSFIVGSFGTLRKGTFREEVLSKLHAEASRRGQSLVVVVAGNLSEAGLSYFLSLGSSLNVRFVNLGKLSFEEVSYFLQSIDLGIGSTPILYAGKSGSIAAMIEHGLPVLLPNDDFNISGVDYSDLARLRLSNVRHISDPDFSVWITESAVAGRGSLAPEIAKIFLEQVGLCDART